MIKTSVTSAAMYRNRIYLQTLYIDKNQSWLCYKCDREHDFDVVLGQVVPCRKLKWICRCIQLIWRDKLKQKVTLQFLSRDKFILSCDMTFLLHGGYIVP